MLTQAKAIAGVKMIDAAMRTRYPTSPSFVPLRGFYQNKRKSHRDLKWDDLNVSFAQKLSAKLDRARISHRMIIVSGRWGGGEYAQIRLDVPLDFSLTLARGSGKKRRAALKPSVQFRRDREELARKIKLLRFGYLGHRTALSEALAALRHLSALL